MGVIGVDDLQEAWLHHSSINAVRERCSIPTSSLATCRDCPYANFCNAGCPGMVMNATDKLNARDPMSCHRL